MANLGEDFTLKNPKKYTCEDCDFITCNKKDYNRHLTTNKHLNNKKGEILGKKGEENPPQKYRCDVCNYNTNDLTKYKRHCDTLRHKAVLEKNHLITTDTTNMGNVIIDKEIFLQLIRNNQELILDNQEFKRMLADLSQKNTELTAVPTANNTINNTLNNTTNNNNQTFNLNVFLNEKCKNAVNWTDFIKGIEITKEDLLRTGAMGFVNGMSHIIIENLKKLSEDRRPLHNTDCKRRTIYVHDDGTWELQEDYSKFEKAADMISDKTKIVWINTNDDHLSVEEDNALMQACVNMATTTAHLEKIPKIFNNVVKSVVVNKKQLE